MKLIDIEWPTKTGLQSICDHIVLKQRWLDNAGPAPNICTNSCNESSGRSVGSAANYYFHLCNKINKCVCIKYVLSRFNYQHISNAFEIIIGVALQEYKEYNNLPHGIW